jgi:hypothetical protein
MATLHTAAASHTAGPWTLQRNVTNYRSGGTSLQVRGGGDELIATFPGCDRDKANAVLMAAAPDMLKALRRAVLALAFAAESSDAMRDDYEAVSAAIAKATGSAA